MYRDPSVTVRPTSRQNLHCAHSAKPCSVALPSMVHHAAWRLARTPGVWESMAVSLSFSNASFFHQQKCPLSHFISTTELRPSSRDRTLFSDLASICVGTSRFSDIFQTDQIQYRWPSSIHGQTLHRTGNVVFGWMDTNLAVGVHWVCLCQTSSVLNYGQRYGQFGENGSGKYSITSYPLHPTHPTNSSCSNPPPIHRRTRHQNSTSHWRLPRPW
jgi:hypothetical protein